MDNLKNTEAQADAAQPEMQDNPAPDAAKTSEQPETVLPQEQKTDDGQQTEEGTKPEISEEEEREIKLSERSSHVERQVHRIGLAISIVMAVAAVAFLGMAIFKVSSANSDFLSGTVTHSTLSSINQIVASVLLMIVTGLTALMFFRLYQKKSPFNRSNIFIMRVIAVTLMLLSVLPMAVQWLVGLFINKNVELKVNLIYIFIGVVFYCMSYIVEQGELMKKQSDDMLALQKSIILQYAEVNENKSGQTSEHVLRMEEYCRVLAKNMGMTDHEAETLGIASIMHDIGKLMIPPEILEKDSSLSDEEFAIMKTHVVAGAEMLLEGKGEVMEEASRISMDHHEHWDGSGYLGKKGDEIDVGAQLVAVANMFDSLVSARSYKKGWEMDKVYSTIIDESGKKLSPAAVNAFKRSYKQMMAIYNDHSKTISYDWKPPEYIIKAYDEILGEFSPRRKPEEVKVDEEAYKHNVELDLRRLI